MTKMNNTLKDTPNDESMKRHYSARKYHRLRQKPRCSSRKSKDYKLYILYSNMLGRCYNPGYYQYPFYGAKGIDVYTPWIYSFDSFMLWALDNGYRDGVSIDRIDSSKGYYPNNCRFISTELNRVFKGNTHAYVLDGVVVTWSDIKVMYGIPGAAKDYIDLDQTVIEYVRDIDPDAKIKVYKF